MNKKIKEYLINKIEEMKVCANSDDYTSEERQACRIAAEAYEDALSCIRKSCIRKPNKNYASIWVQPDNSIRRLSYYVYESILLYYLRNEFPYKTTVELIGINNAILKKIEGVCFDGGKLLKYDNVTEGIAKEAKKFIEREECSTLKLYKKEVREIWECLM